MISREELSKLSVGDTIWRSKLRFYTHHIGTCEYNTPPEKLIILKIRYGPGDVIESIECKSPRKKNVLYLSKPTDYMNCYLSESECKEDYIAKARNEMDRALSWYETVRKSIQAKIDKV